VNRAFLNGLYTGIVASRPEYWEPRPIGLSGPNESGRRRRHDDPVEAAYKKLLEEDDAAQEEVDQWIKDNGEVRRSRPLGCLPRIWNRRIRDRFEPVPQRLRGFSQAYIPGTPKPGFAYGSFL